MDDLAIDLVEAGWRRGTSSTGAARARGRSPSPTLPGCRSPRVLAGDHRLAIDRMALIGHSAGGHLVLWAGARRGHGPVGEATVDPALVVPLAPVTDLVECAASRARRSGGPSSSRRARRRPDRYRLADPMQRLPVGVPTAIVQGLADGPDLIDHSRRFAAAAASLGEPVELIEIERPTTSTSSPRPRRPGPHPPRPRKRLSTGRRVSDRASGGRRPRRAERRAGRRRGRRGAARRHRGADRIRAVGLNFLDLMRCRGTYPLPPAFPLTFGVEVAGRVVEAGRARPAVGSDVLACPALPRGALAERVVVDARFVVPRPDDVGPLAAAALPVNYQTAWFGLDRAGVGEGTTVLDPMALASAQRRRGRPLLGLDVPRATARRRGRVLPTALRHAPSRAGTPRHLRGGRAGWCPRCSRRARRPPHDRQGRRRPLARRLTRRLRVA